MREMIQSEKSVSATRFKGHLEGKCMGGGYSLSVQMIIRNERQ